MPQLFAAIERLETDGVVPTLCLMLDTCRDASAAVCENYTAHASRPVLVGRGAG